MLPSNLAYYAGKENAVQFLQYSYLPKCFVLLFHPIWRGLLNITIGKNNFLPTVDGIFVIHSIALPIEVSKNK